ncbi:leukocyte elastase inhibitor-like [Oncorhynchus clarkii lewisi]|uniref:leukocyte elastase inhibitor-like n=1 Tax=Oncorhynchus clarkii lewisi TaxID=490388 RepID=UPI0039B9B92D
MGSGFSGCVRQQSPNKSKEGEAIPFSNPSSTVRNSNTAFALGLYRTLSENHADGNIFFSPLSISSALAMVYLGAKGDTAEQMAKQNFHYHMAVLPNQGATNLLWLHHPLFVILHCLTQLERELTPERIHKWTKRQKMGTRTKVQVSIPKFKLQEDYQLNTPLASLGMVDVFDQGRADLSGMSAAMEEEVYLSTVAHKAFVDVNERGTEAGASTGAEGKMYGFSNMHYFTADHPLIFFIRHNQTQSILFLGRFSSPEEGDREGRFL